MISYRDILVTPDETVQETIELITENRSGYAIVVDEDRTFRGIVGDGDIRRALLNGLSLDKQISEIMTEDAVVAREDMSEDEKQDLVSFRYRVVPVLDEDDRVVGAEFYQDQEGRDDIRNRRVSVVGLGFVGLTLAVTLADVGFTVTGIDKNSEVVESLREGIPPFYESGLEMYLNRVLDRRLDVGTSLEPKRDDVYIVAVGTPVDSETKEPRLEAVRDASRHVGSALKQNDLVILRSTVPVGTTRNEVLPVLEEESGLSAGEDFGLVFAPERTIAGNALNELRELPQIIGAIDEESQIEASRLFNEVTDSIVKVESLEAAEMSKIIDNSYRDVTFAYANQMAKVCEAIGLDMAKLVDAVNLGYDRNQVPKPSPGVGGACLSKDPYILNYVGEQYGEKPDLVESAREVNESMPEHVAGEIEKMLSRTEKKEPLKLLILGFAFKGRPETSDMRNSPTLDLIESFDDSVVDLYGSDPVVSDNSIRELGVTPVDPEEGFRGADAVVIMTNHPDFAKLDVFDLLPEMDLPAVFYDGWQLFEPEDIESIPGILYGGVGYE